MAGSSLILLLDDIATVLDDVALLSKIAAKKTAGVLGDDLALNAEQVSGVRAERELPVVWAVAKGSAKNKLILVPAALAISAVAPWAVTPLLMVGGAYLCYEGAEKLVHVFGASDAEEIAHEAALLEAVARPDVDLVALEGHKIKGAVRTDFVLSAEIVAITLGSVAGAAFGTQVLVLTLVAAAMTVGVYGLVAGIVKLDDVGLHLVERRGTTAAARAARLLGRVILAGAPYLMKLLSVAGTAAMFLVGGGILSHGVPWAARWIERLEHASVDLIGSGLAGALVPAVLNGVLGILAGAALVAAVALFTRMRRRPIEPRGH